MSEAASVPGLLIVAAVTALTLLGHVTGTVLDLSGPIRRRHFAEESGGRLLALYRRSPQLSGLRTLLRLGSLAGALALVLLVPGASGGRLTPWAGFAVVLGLLAATELAARVLVRRDSEEALERLRVIYSLVALIFAPLLPALAGLYQLLAGVPDDEEEDDDATTDEIEAFLTVGAEEGILEPEDEDLIQRVIDFGDARVRSVMTPRIDMICAPASSSLEELADAFLESRHSRLPIYRESVDEIVGVLHIRDFFAALRSESETRPEAVALKPYFVPETKPLGRLLREFQSQRQQIAIVVDEYGGTAGLVTIEDLLEKIVGDIVDEYEIDVFETELLANGRWRVAGKTDLSTLGQLFDLEIDEPYETVGGMIFGWLGSVPEEGSVAEGHGLRLTVESVVDRRIRSVLVERLESAEDAV